jgi:cobalt-zinc-cadmium efflux system protein
MKKHQKHDHSHQGCHTASIAFNKAFIIATLANSLFVLVQIFYSIMANSSSLMADAVHNLGDVVGLAVSWLANWLLQKKPTAKRTFGYKKISILATLANGIMLVFSSGLIVADALYRLWSVNADIKAPTVMLVALIGIVVNGSTAALFFRGQADLNIKSAYLHLFYDALISLGVVGAALVMWFTHWYWLDPLIGILIALIIIKGTWQLFIDGWLLLVDAVPRDLSSIAVYDFLMAQKNIIAVHDLHIWALSTRENALSVHLVVASDIMDDKARKNLVDKIKQKFNIHHTTIQIEQDTAFCDEDA